jgi:hypothetical protein
VLTLTLTGLAADTQLPGGEPWPVAARRIAAVVAMLVGAFLLRSSLALPLFVAAALVAALTVVYVARVSRGTARHVSESTSRWQVSLRTATIAPMG